MVPMNKDEKFMKIHNELYSIVEILQEIVKRVIIVKEELHTLDGQQRSIEEFAGDE